MDNVVSQMGAILMGSDLTRLVFSPGEVEFKFNDENYDPTILKSWLEALQFDFQKTGKIVTTKRVSQDDAIRLYPNLSDYFLTLSDDIKIADSQSAIVIDREDAYVYYYNHFSKAEVSSNDDTKTAVSKITNFRAYNSLLRIFFESEQLVEFNDKIKKRIFVIDNGKTKNVASIKYELYDPKIFSKRVDADINYIIAYTGNKEWLSSFKHHVVAIIESQEDADKTFTEIKYIVSNADNDFDIYVQEFSFEKISKELKDEKQKYFDQLNQTQDKIKSQVISVPLSVGTSIFAFYQLQVSKSTLYFLLLAIGIYIVFIEIYLYLYDQDLKYLKKEIESDSKKFVDFYPKIFKLFESDYKYILAKVRTVIILSNAIKVILLIDWIILLIYIFFFHKQVPTNPLFGPKLL
jgi:hypothetical protein